MCIPFSRGDEHVKTHTFLSLKDYRGPRGSVHLMIVVSSRTHLSAYLRYYTINIWRNAVAKVHPPGHGGLPTQPSQLFTPQ